MNQTCWQNCRYILKYQRKDFFYATFQSSCNSSTTFLSRSSSNETSSSRCCSDVSSWFIRASRLTPDDAREVACSWTSAKRFWKRSKTITNPHTVAPFNDMFWFQERAFQDLLYKTKSLQKLLFNDAIRSNLVNLKHEAGTSTGTSSMKQGPPQGPQAWSRDLHRDLKHEAGTSTGTSKLFPQNPHWFVLVKKDPADQSKSGVDVNNWGAAESF